MSAVELNPPLERKCTRCGRRDVWDTDEGGWIIEADEPESSQEWGFCIHEWDINGSHNPIRE